MPFVREIFAEVEQLPAFTRAASHLRESAGRMSVTGLSAAAKALIVVLLRRTVERPFVLVVADNRAAEELLAGTARVLRTDWSCRSGLGRKPSGARCAALSEFVAASGDSGRTRYGVVEDCDRPRRYRHFSGDRDHNSSSLSRLLRRPGAGSASRREFRSGEAARAPEHGRLQRNRCGGNAGAVRGSRRHSRCVFSRSGPAGARRVFRR